MRGRVTIVSNDLHTAITADPNIALPLLALGLIGIYVEFCAPGKIIPGVSGSALALLAIASLRIFPIAWPGALLIVLALVFLILEARFVSRGVFTLGGAAALLAGLKLLIATNDPARCVHWATAILIAVPFSLVTSFFLAVAARARRNKTVVVAGDMLK